MPNDQGIALFDYPDGLLAEVSCSFTAAAGENTTEIVGERGVLVQNWGDAPSAVERFDCAAPSLKWFLRDRGEWVVSDVEAPRAQAERIAGLAGPLATAAEGRDALRMVLACYEANEEGRRVALG